MSGVSSALAATGGFPCPPTWHDYRFPSASMPMHLLGHHFLRDCTALSCALVLMCCGPQLYYLSFLKLMDDEIPCAKTVEAVSKHLGQRPVLEHSAE
eukprot:UN4158